MKFILLGCLGLTLVSCTSLRYASTTEYDDAYYLPGQDVTQPYAENSVSGFDDQNVAYAPATRPADDTYADYYYDDDDFFFSRRVRRFSQANTNSWRYYDPYFSNDLYFVMGTNSWNNWYNAGWYDWNRPRFGRFGYGRAPLAWDPFWNDPFYNPGFAFDYYNPWVNTYYGGRPVGFNNTWGGAWGSPWAVNSGYLCPPVRSFTSPWNQRVRTQRRTSRNATAYSRNVRYTTGTGTPRTNASTRNNYSPTRNPNNTASRTGRIDYTRPSRNATTTRPSSTRPTTTRPSSTRPSSTRPSSTRPSSTRPSSTRPSSTRPSSTRPSSTRPSSTRPSSTRPSSTRPSSTRPSSTRPSSTRPSSTRPSSTRPNSSVRPNNSSRSSSRPSSSVRPNSSSRSSSRPSSSVRPNSSRSSSRPSYNRSSGSRSSSTRPSSSSRRRQ
ncbi:MAG: hypothetical protein AAFQ83_08875 [Bacteroidota bacterium]